MTDPATISQAAQPAEGGINPFLLTGFISTSIQTAQAIIQATDVKLNILIAILLLPLTRLDQLVGFLSQHRPATGLGAAVVFTMTALLALAWLAALFTTLRGLISIRDAASHIQGDRPPQVKGCFYNGDLFSHSLLHGVGLSHRTIDQQVLCFPVDLEGLLKEMAWEQMKLTYIREVKMRRQRLAYLAAVIAIGLALLLWPVNLWLS